MCVPNMKLPGIPGLPDPNRPLTFAQRIAKKAKKYTPPAPGRGAVDKAVQTVVARAPRPY